MQVHLNDPVAIVQVSVEAIAQQIQVEHLACCTAATRALEHAMRCGDLLLQAKAEVPHGGWQSWLGKNFSASERTARAYMQLASNRDRLESKRQSTAILTIGEALEVIAEPRYPDPGDKSFIDPALPELDGVRSYYAEGENRRDCQLWASKKYPGYYYQTILDWSRENTAQTVKPFKFCHAMLAHSLRMDSFSSSSAWSPIATPILPVVEWGEA